MTVSTKIFSLKPAVLILIILSFLIACAQISLSAAWSLRNLDYLLVDTEQARLALTLPDDALLDEATMTLKYSENGKVILDHLIQLEIITSERELARVNFPPEIKNRLVLRVPLEHVDKVAN